MKKRWLALLFSLIILLFLFLRTIPDDRLHLVFCDVGEGDAILITYRTTQVLIDGGEGERVLACLYRHLPFWDRKIELVILTHPEKDHYGGLAAVFSRWWVGKFASLPFGLKNRPGFEELIKLVSEQKVYSFFPSQGDKIRIGLMQFDIIWPDKNKQKELFELKKEGEKLTKDFFLIEEEKVSPNEYSLVFVFRVAGFRALFLGDLPGRISQFLSWRRQFPQVELVKASHHGAEEDNPPILYQITSPKQVVISVGKNRFGHPSEELIKRLKEEGIRVRRTDQEGEISICL